MKKRISIMGSVLTAVALLVMLASVAPANAETFLVSIYGQGVHAWEWPNGASVTMNIYVDGTASVPFCTDTQTSPPDGQGFSFNLSGCQDVQPGNYVVVTDGTNPKDHLVMDLALTKVDTETDFVAGTVAPSEWVALQVVTTGWPWTTIYNEMDVVQADASGNWEFTFPVNLEARSPKH